MVFIYLFYFIDRINIIMGRERGFKPVIWRTHVDAEILTSMCLWIWSEKILNRVRRLLTSIQHLKMGHHTLEFDGVAAKRFDACQVFVKMSIRVDAFRFIHLWAHLTKSIFTFDLSGTNPNQSEQVGGVEQPQDRYGLYIWKQFLFSLSLRYNTSKTKVIFSRINGSNI